MWSWTDSPDVIATALATAASPLLPPGPIASPDLSDFERQTWSFGDLNQGQVVQLAAYGMGYRADTRPELVPLDVLDLMMWHPPIYAGIRTVTGPALDSELYFVRHDDPRIRAETEAWLRPLLPKLLPAIVRAFAYGAMPLVLDWEVERLGFTVPKSSAAPTNLSAIETAVEAELASAGTRNRSIPGHVHYRRVHEIWPGEVQLRVLNDELLGVIYGGKEYGGESLDDPGQVRAFVAVWDQAFGRWLGQGALRRAFSAWFEAGMNSLWENRYMERAVDLPRLGFAPEGDVNVAGQKMPATKLLRAQIMALRNGSALILPSTQDANGNKAWDVKVLESPDRHNTFEKKADRCDKRMLWACLAPTGSVDKDTAEVFSDHVQSVCDFAAEVASRIVRVVHRVRYGDSTSPALVLANDVPKRKRRILQEIFARAADAMHHMPDGRVYSLAELVHPELLDQLGVRALSPEDAAHKPAPSPSTLTPGRPPDAAGGRAERRDRANTVDGEVNTGAPSGKPHGGDGDA